MSDNYARGDKTRKAEIRLLAQEAIQGGVAISIARLVQQDKHLFATGAQERSIVFRLATYLRDIFEGNGLHIDCEYNRRGHEIDVAKYLAWSSAIPVLVVPDVVLHKRGINRHNELVIEVKTTRQDAKKMTTTAQS